MSSVITQLPIQVKGHIKIVDDLGNVLLDKDNAVHPENMARVFARALSDENNYFINRIAFGNGGTTVNAALVVTYKTPNDGQPPDTATWDSRLYNETYSEIVDAGQTVLNPNLGIDFGSADANTGVRTGGGSIPADDPPSVLHVSGPGVRSQETGLVSEAVIYSVLNANEPMSQFLSDTNAPTNITPGNANGDFVFDEIGLYTSGAQAISTSGYQYINVGDQLSTSNTGLLPGTSYSFNVVIDGGTPVIVTFTTPASGGSGPGGQILYGDLCQAINTVAATWSMVSGLPNGATMSITDLTGGTFPTISNAMTYGFLSVESSTSGSLSSVNLSGVNTTALLGALNPPTEATLEPSVQGVNAGVQNDPTTPSLERERLLTHIIFNPITKTANRILSITYTLSISVARSV